MFIADLLELMATYLNLKLFRSTTSVVFVFLNKHVKERGILRANLLDNSEN